MANTREIFEANLPTLFPAWTREELTARNALGEYDLFVSRVAWRGFEAGYESGYEEAINFIAEGR